MPKKAFFKVFLSDDVRTITKRIDDSKTISELKREVLKRVDVPRPRDKEKDFILLAPRKQINLAGDANCSVLSNGDVLIMCKNLVYNMVAFRITRWIMHAACKIIGLISFHM